MCSHLRFCILFGSQKLLVLEPAVCNTEETRVHMPLTNQAMHTTAFTDMPKLSHFQFN